MLSRISGVIVYQFCLIFTYVFVNIGQYSPVSLVIRMLRSYTYVSKYGTDTDIFHQTQDQ